jgi:hypothetical protein
VPKHTVERQRVVAAHVSFDTIVDQETAGAGPSSSLVGHGHGRRVACHHG